MMSGFDCMTCTFWNLKYVCLVLILHFGEQGEYRFCLIPCPLYEAVKGYMYKERERKYNGSDTALWLYYRGGLLSEACYCIECLIPAKWHCIDDLCIEMVYIALS